MHHVSFICYNYRILSFTSHSEQNSLTTTQQTGTLESLAEQQPELRELLDAPIQAQHERGYYYTLREICQQPSTWLATSETMLGAAPAIARSLDGIKSLILTGSGSSEYAGVCVRLPLEGDLGIFTESIGGGMLLTFASQSLPPERPALVVSLSRSGESPESVGIVSMLLKTEPELRHLILTCNAEGGLAPLLGDHRSREVPGLTYSPKAGGKYWRARWDSYSRSFESVSLISRRGPSHRGQVCRERAPPRE